jgi:hypothetical protein
MAKTIADLSAVSDVINERLESTRRGLEDERTLGRERDRMMMELRQENAVLRQRLDDHLKRVETWSARLWALVSVLIGAVLSLESGLIVTLVRK